MPKQKTERKRARISIRMVFYALFWLLLLSATSVVMVMQASRYNTYRDVLAQVEADLRKEERTNMELQEQMYFYDSDAYIEQLAREHLGYVKPDEIIFINVAE